MHIKSQLHDVQAAYFLNPDGELQNQAIKFSLQSGTRNWLSQPITGEQINAIRRSGVDPARCRKTGGEKKGQDHNTTLLFINNWLISACSRHQIPNTYSQKSIKLMRGTKNDCLLCFFNLKRFCQVPHFILYTFHIAS